MLVEPNMSMRLQRKVHNNKATVSALGKLKQTQQECVVS
jgi:hypothetical protein